MRMGSPWSPARSKPPRRSARAPPSSCTKSPLPSSSSVLLPSLRLLFPPLCHRRAHHQLLPEHVWDINDLQWHPLPSHHRFHKLRRFLKGVSVSCQPRPQPKWHRVHRVPELRPDLRLLLLRHKLINVEDSIRNWCIFVGFFIGIPLWGVCFFLSCWNFYHHRSRFEHSHGNLDCKSHCFRL